MGLGVGSIHFDRVFGFSCDEGQIDALAAGCSRGYAARLGLAPQETSKFRTITCVFDFDENPVKKSHETHCFFGIIAFSCRLSFADGGAGISKTQTLLGIIMKKKLVYYENDSIDPYFNLALEEYLLLNHCDEEDILLLWKNEPTVVIGRHQNTIEEVDMDFAACHGIHVVRRISGGGAVFHDLGNLNYSFLGVDTGELFDFSRFTRPLIHALARLGLSAENGGRNDVLINGRKISGNAQFRRHNRVLHHGTILFNTDLNRLSQVLHATSKIYVTSGIASIRARVVNVLECLQQGGRDMTLTEFQSRFLDEIHRSATTWRKNLTVQDRNRIEQLCNEKYRSKKWNFGGPQLKKWNHCVSQRFDWGTLDVRLSISDNIVQQCKIFGDFFCRESPNEICRDLVGLRFELQDFEDRLDKHKIKRAFPELEKSEFIKMFFGPSDKCVPCSMDSEDF